MKKTIHVVLSCVIGSVLLLGCEKKDTTPRGDIEGNLLYSNRRLITDADFEITLLNEGFVKRVNSKNGKYLITDIKSGNYKIVFKNKDYFTDTLKFPHVAGGLPTTYNIVPFKKPDYKLEITKIEKRFESYLYFEVESSKPVVEFQNFVVFFTKNKSTFDKEFAIVEGGGVSPGSKGFTYDIESLKIRLKAVKGETIYLKIVPGLLSTKEYTDMTKYSDFPFLVYENGSKVAEMRL